MKTNKTIVIWMTIGASIGGYIPIAWGASTLSYQSIFLSAVGGLLGIWYGYRKTHKDDTYLED
jgi:hypothetical protein